MLQAMITECLLRALGLPGFSKLNTQSVLSNWNSPMDYLSKTQALDGDDAKWKTKPSYEDERKFLSSAKIIEVIKETTPTSYEREMQFLSNFPEDMAKTAKPYTVFTLYDRFLVSLLYCSAIEPGMDKYQTILALLENQNCFK